MMVFRTLARLFLALAAIGVLAACSPSQESLKVGSKDFSESVILAEMIAAIAEAQDIAVTRRTRLGPTLVNLEALKSGDIDIYPEYNGTGLVMLGQPALADGDEAMRRVRELYEPLGLVWGDRFGFANNYGIAMRSSRAERLGIASISDLAEQAADLTIGIDNNFESRPLDGFPALTNRYGMEFGGVEVVDIENRSELYNQLLAGDIDVVEVFTTDPQIQDLNLAVLDDSLEFFPVYQAAPLMRADALLKHPRLREAVAALAGKLDEATMRRLIGQVDVLGIAPQTVARAALSEMGLLDETEEFEISDPLSVAVSPSNASAAEAGQALAAVREAFPERRVLVATRDDPLAAVAAGEARIALAAGVEFAEVSEDGVVERPFEALGVVGQSHLHLIAGTDGPSALSAVSVLATGPEGSASHRAGEVLASGIEALEIVPAEDAEVASLFGAADAALIVAPLEATVVAEALEGRRLVPVDNWNAGANLVRFPQLREARIPPGTYEGQNRAVETLSSQLVLAGPVVESTDVTGPAGPGATAPTQVSPIQPQTARELSKALGGAVGFDPAIRRAAALRPTLPEPDAPVNPSMALSMMSVGVFVLFGWLIWLYGRPSKG